MKRYITSIAVLSVLLFISCACDKNSGDSGKDDVDVEFTATGWNGYFAEALAKAYDEFEETGDIPAIVNVEGLKYNRGRYLAAGIQILRKIIAEPDTWQDEDVTYIIASGPDSYANNTFNDDVMTFDAFMDVLDIAYEYAGERNVFPNYCTTETEHKDPDGSVYSVKMTINTIYVMMTRVFAYFVENNSLRMGVAELQQHFQGCGRDHSGQGRKLLRPDTCHSGHEPGCRHTGQIQTRPVPVRERGDRPCDSRDLR